VHVCHGCYLVKGGQYSIGVVSSEALTRQKIVYEVWKFGTVAAEEIRLTSLGSHVTSIAYLFVIALSHSSA
jgi:hypothetical protein